MKVLILGCGSFAGQAYFAHCLEQGIETHGINRSKPKDSKFWPWVDNFDINSLWHTYNLYDSPDSIIECIKSIQPNLIVDFMGQGMVAPSWEDPALWYQINITNKAKVINSLINNKYLDAYIRASTPEVYGSSTKYITPENYFNPSTPYAVSHASIDYHIRCLGRQYDFPYFIARFANFYGPGQQLYRVIPKLILSALTRTNFILDGGGKSLRSFIYSSDICSAIDSIITKKNSVREYHFAGNEEISIASLVDLICNLLNADREKFVHEGPDRPGKDLCYRLNIENSEKELAWEPSVSLQSGIILTSNWISSNLNSLKEESWNYHHQA